MPSHSLLSCILPEIFPGPDLLQSHSCLCVAGFQTSVSSPLFSPDCRLSPIPSWMSNEVGSCLSDIEPWASPGLGLWACSYGLGMFILALSCSEPYEAGYLFGHFHGLDLCPVFHCAASCPPYLPPVHLVMTVVLLASSLSAPTQLKDQSHAGHA